MKINITKEQYKELILMLAISNGMVGILGDALPETDYKKRSDKMEKLESYFLQYAPDYGCEGLVQKHDDNNLLADEVYESEIMPIISDFEDYATRDNLANILAWRDFRREYTQEELDEMARKNDGYFGVEIYGYEKKYWDEFDENEFDRLEIKE